MKELEYEELWEDAAVEAVCEEEAELVEELSLKTLKKGVVKGKLVDDVRMLRYFLRGTKESQKVYEILRDIYFEEFSRGCSKNPSSGPSPQPLRELTR